jgi:nicotinate phosphoribosyltransferase
MAQRTIPPPLRPPERVPPERFHLPVERIRAGYYSDKYFVRTRDVLAATGRNPIVTMQVFQKQHAWLGGVDEAIAVLKLCLTEGYRWEDIEVLTLRDGDKVAPLETVMLITGPYQAFAHLETVYLGVLARRTRVATNTRLVVEAAWPKPVMFFPARFDHWLVQTGDGYAPSVCPPTHRHRGGDPRGSARSPTR